MSEKIVSINGKDYKPEDFDENQSYMIDQIRFCQNKANGLRFELDQVQAAQNAFTNSLIASLSEESKAEAS